ncbi:MAG: acyltransferase domain-containing protein, partial [Cyanobacteriota bacterium]
MAGELLEHQPLFRNAIERVATLLDPLMAIPLIEFLQPPSGREQELAKALTQTANTQPVLFAVGYALAELWSSWGLEPDLLLGHSVGEVVAAHSAGVFDLADACRLIVARGRLMQQLPADGGMVAVLASPERLQPWLEASRSLVVAALNGPSNTVISGTRPDLDALLRSAEAAGLVCHPLAVSHPFHSPAMEPMLGSFEEELRQLRYRLPKLPLVSNVTGELAGPEIATPDYWCEHVVSPVRFADGLRTLLDQGATTFLEIGARPTLIGMARQQITEREQEEGSLRFLASLSPGRPDLEVILSSLAELHCSGESIDWQRFHAPFQSRREKLPGYPFERQRYWWSAPEQSPGPATVWMDLLGTGNSPASQPPQLRSSALMRLDLPGRERRYEATLSARNPADLADHRIRGQVVFPAAGFLGQAMELLRKEGAPQRVRTFRLDQPLRLRPDGDPHRLQLVWNPQEHVLRFHSSSTPEGDWIDHGGLRTDLPSATSPPWLPDSRPASAETVPLSPFYDALAAFGLEYGPTYRQLTGLWCDADRAWADLERQAGADDRGLLDSCFQVVAAALDPGLQAGSLLLPVGLESFELTVSPLPDRFSCEVRVRASDEPAFVLADLVLHDQGRPLGWIEAFRLRRIPRQVLEWMFPDDEALPSGVGPEQWLLESRWHLIDSRELADAPAASPPRRPVLLGCRQERAAGLRGWCAVVGAGLKDESFPPSETVTLSDADAVFIWPDLQDETVTLKDVCGELLSLAQSFSTDQAPRRVVLVLDGGRTVRERTLIGGLRGWWRTVALEQSQLNWTLLELPPNPGHLPAAVDWQRIWGLSAREATLAWRDGRLCRPQLEPLSLERYRWATASSGSLDSLVRKPLNEHPLAPGELEVAVEA